MPLLFAKSLPVLIVVLILYLTYLGARRLVKSFDEIRDESDRTRTIFMIIVGFVIGFVVITIILNAA